LVSCSFFFLDLIQAFPLERMLFVSRVCVTIDQCCGLRLRNIAIDLSCLMVKTSVRIRISSVIILAPDFFSFVDLDPEIRR
jgi:hypothetical protein